MSTGRCENKQCTFGFPGPQVGYKPSIGWNGANYLMALCEGCTGVARAEGTLLKYSAKQEAEFARIEAEYVALGETLPEKFINHVLQKIERMRAEGAPEEAIATIVIDARINYRLLIT